MDSSILVVCIAGKDIFVLEDFLRKIMNISSCQVLDALFFDVVVLFVDCQILLK